MTTAKQVEKQASYGADALNLACTLLDAWGYDRTHLATATSLDFFLDMDVTSPIRHRMVCRCVCAYSGLDPPRYYSAPTTPGERGRTPTEGWDGPDYCSYGVQPDMSSTLPRGDYVIPDFDHLIRHADDHASLYLHEDLVATGEDNDDTLTRELCLPYPHPVHERGDFHVELLRRWIGLLDADERMEYGLYPSVTPVKVISTQEAADHLSEGGKHVYAFTTTPGPHCIFTMGLRSHQNGSVIAGLKVTVPGEVGVLSERGYHLYLSRKFPSILAARDALFELRRAALKLE